MFFWKYLNLTKIIYWTWLSKIIKSKFGIIGKCFFVISDSVLLPSNSVLVSRTSIVHVHLAMMRKLAEKNALLTGRQTFIITMWKNYTTYYVIIITQVHYNYQYVFQVREWNRPILIHSVLVITWRVSWDKFLECSFLNFEIVRVKRGQFQIFQKSRGWSIPKTTRNKHVITG